MPFRADYMPPARGLAPRVAQWTQLWYKGCETISVRRTPQENRQGVVHALFRISASEQSRFRGE